MPYPPDRQTCVFTYADGRRCTMPQFPDDMGLCYYHGQERRKAFVAEQAGTHISNCLNTDIVTACDLSSALASAFAATAQGFIEPKQARALASLAALLLKTHALAKQEFLEAFDEKWPDVVAQGPTFTPADPGAQTAVPSTPDCTADPTPVLVPDAPANEESHLTQTESVLTSTPQNIHP